MKTLEFGQESSLAQILESIKATEDLDVTLDLPEDSPVHLNPVNKEIIEKFAKKEGKQVSIKGLPILKKAGDEEFRFVEGEDIAEKGEAQPQESLPTKQEGLGAAQDKPSEAPKKGGGPFKFISNLKGRKKLAFFGGVGLFIFAILFFISFWFLPSADVKIVVEGETKTNQITLTASQKASEVDVENKTIPLNVEEVTKSGVEKGDATGKLVVGTPSKGRVTIGNFSMVTSKKYSAGTNIKSISGQNQGLEFTLETAVTVPKASSSGFSIVAGQAGVNVTAKKIGSSGNLPAGSEFQVGSEDVGTVKAVNDIAFSGGESKEVTAVSEEDRKKLKEDLLEKLSKEAKEELENKLEGSTVPEGGLKTEIIKEKYDKVVGEEAKEVTLTLEVKATAKLFKEDDLKKLLIESVKPSVPDGFVVDEEGSTVEAELFETEGEDDVEILGKINAVLIPDMNEEDLQKNLSGKSFGSAASYLQGLDNAPEFEIEIKPSIFRIFKFMPFNSSRINVTITKQEDSTGEATPAEDQEESSEEDAD
jgi:hypothetical protein